MSRLENLDGELTRQQEEERALIGAQGGMTANDPYMRFGHLAQLFCIGFAFVAPVLLFWTVAL